MTKKKSKKKMTGKKTTTRPKYKIPKDSSGWKKCKKAAKKKIKKKKAKAKTKKPKKAKRKTAEEKAAKEGKPYGLQAKRLSVMEAIPILPCSAISKDMQGLRYCHTQAEHVYQEYRREMVRLGLTITMYECNTETVQTFESKEHQKFFSSRAHCRFRIRDIETGQYEEIQSSALGSNDVWSDNSAQTVAMKQALLQYFFTAWPQPANHVEVVRDSLNELPTEEFKKALIKMMPKKYMSTKGAAAALEGYFKKLGI